MASGQRRARSGFTLVELLAVVVVIAVLAVVLLDRMLWYQERAEKIAMESVISIVRAALHLQAAGRLVRGEGPELRVLVEENPMTWLATRPANYLGSLDRDAIAAAPVGHWYFDTADNTLVYRLRNYRYFEASEGGRPEVREVRFRTVIDYGASEDGAVAVLRSLDVRPVRPYRWFADDE
jgi:prepilin-type N-terminal cleavage/methylation domain-containing protein